MYVKFQDGGWKCSFVDLLSEGMIVLNHLFLNLYALNCVFTKSTLSFTSAYLVEMVVRFYFSNTVDITITLPFHCRRIILALTGLNCIAR